MSLPPPNLATITRTAFALVEFRPAAAADAIRLIQRAIEDGLSRDGWQPDHAEAFADRFGELVAAQIDAMARDRNLH